MWRGLGRGKGAFLPEAEHLFQAVEDPRKAGDDESVDPRRDADMLLRRHQGGAEAGKLRAQRGGLYLHTSEYKPIYRPFQEIF